GETPDSRRGGQQSAVLELAIEGGAPGLPENWQRADNSQPVRIGNRLFYRQIDVICDSLPVRFILIPKGPGDSANDPDAFYIMCDKVSVALFRRFAQAESNKNAEMAFDVEVEDEQKVKHKINVDERCPIFAVDPDTAYACARRIGGPKGHLPKRNQWD